MLLRLCVLCILVVVALCQDSLYDFSVENSEGEMVPLSTYSSKRVIIVVNVASNCGYTYTNYRGLVELYERYKEHGLEILAFPSNQFGEQEPGSDSEIGYFAHQQGATFPVFKKVDVNGPNAIPLFKFLKQKAGQTEIQWNFNKFMVVNGKPVYRYRSAVKPQDMEEDVLHHLASVAGETGSTAGEM